MACAQLVWSGWGKKERRTRCGAVRCCAVRTALCCAILYCHQNDKQSPPFSCPTPTSFSTHAHIAPYAHLSCLCWTNRAPCSLTLFSLYLRGLLLSSNWHCGAGNVAVLARTLDWIARIACMHGWRGFQEAKVVMHTHSKNLGTRVPNSLALALAPRLCSSSALYPPPPGHPRRTVGLTRLIVLSPAVAVAPSQCPTQRR